jgi:hypothetical protein
LITTIIINLAGLFVIASCVYDMYLNYKSDKFNEEMRETNKELERQVKQMNTPKISIQLDGKEIVKTINKSMEAEQRKAGL